ncbi:MAG: glycosyl transferase [Candidatus Angelobacter sp. Gp1-AA117]|nr:MAG: glycosyl transferase [Candidatus Angelobacter sp. Gp1-AA117]
MNSGRQNPYIQVIVPARNEQECIGRCLQSLTGQQGIDFQITVVDDGSTDQTRSIAESFAGVSVISSREPAPGISGKCNALIMAAVGSRARWLLFTDADTFHLPGSLAAAVAEAEERNVDLLSYSPEQEVVTWSEYALMPVVFADLTRTYPTEAVNDPASPVVAANGQYLLVRREVYEQLGGHAAVATCVLEDVEIARLFKNAGRRTWFRYGGGIVRTRMYRSFSAMVEGWTKNLTLLFHHTVLLAIIRLLEFGIITGALIAGAILLTVHHPQAGWALPAAAGVFYFRFLLRIRAAHFSWRANFMAIFGLPLFAVLLLRSYLHAMIRGAVTWKGRRYTHSEPTAVAKASMQEGNFIIKG